MYVIGYNNKDVPTWRICFNDNAFLKTLEDARKDRDYWRKQYPGDRFEIFQCSILQTLDPKVFEEE